MAMAMANKLGKAAELSSGNWLDLRDMLMLTSPMLTSGNIQSSIWLYIVRKTVGLKQFEDDFRMKHFLEGQPTLGYLGVPTPDRIFIWKMKKDLEARKLIYIEQLRDNGTALAKDRIRCNVWGLLRFMLQALAEKSTGLQNTDDFKAYLDEAAKKIASLAGKVEAVWKENSWELEDIESATAIVKIRDAVDRGKKKTDEAIGKRRSRRAAQVLKAGWVRDLLKEFGHEYNMGVETKWSSKDFGMAKNFLKSCYDADEEPRDVLREVVKRWHEFTKGVILTLHKKPIPFPEWVTFGHFYKHRNAVMQYLQENPVGTAEEAGYNIKWHGKL